jgi:hypothetical protein
MLCLPPSPILCNDSKRFREDEIIEDGSRVHQFYLTDRKGNHHIAAKGGLESDSDHFTYSAHPQLTELKTLWSCSSVEAVRSWLSSIMEIPSCRPSHPLLFHSAQVPDESAGHAHPNRSTSFFTIGDPIGQPDPASASRPSSSSLHDQHSASALHVACDSKPVPASHSTGHAHHLHAALRKRKASDDPIAVQPHFCHDPHHDVVPVPTRSITASAEIFDGERCSDKAECLPRSRSL